MRVFRFFLFLFVLNMGKAQSLIFDKISKKDGLAGNDILCMVQDNYGHLWFGGFNGLTLYNGHSFRTWQHERGDSTSLPDNLIFFLTATPHHSLLVGYIHLGVFVFDYQKERFLPLDPSQKDPHKKWLSAYYAKSGTIYVGSSDGLEYFDTVRQQLVPIELGIHDPLFVSSISEDEKGGIWFMCNSHQVARYDPLTKKTWVLPFGNNQKGLMNRGGKVAYDSKGYIWIGSEYDGMYVYDCHTQEMSHLCTSNGKLASDMVLSFLKDQTGGMWVGTDNGGLYHFNSPKDAEPEHYTFDTNNDNSISSNTIYEILRIEPNLIMLGTYAGGLNIVNGFRHKFASFTAKGTKGKALSQRSVLSFQKAAHGKIWVGTDGGGLNLYDPKTQSYQYFSKENGKMPFSNVAKSVFVDSKSRILVGSYAGGVAVFDSNFRHLRTFSPEAKHKINSFHVWTIAEDAEHRIWLGTLNNGIERISSDLEQVSHYSFSDRGHHGLKSPRVDRMLVDHAGTLWAVSEGLHYYDSESDTFLEYKWPGVQLPENLFDLCEDKEGNIWAGGGDAAFFKMYPDKSNPPEIYHASDGWLGTVVMSIQDDNEGNIWFATDVGISCMKKEAGDTRFLNFDLHDGVLSGQFNTVSKMKDGHGRIYFGGTTGYNCFHPSKIKLNKHLPKVSISDIRVYNEPLSSLDKYNKERAVFWNDSTIKLEYRDKMISIEFAGLDFVLPEKNTFSYILEGFDKHWNYSRAGIHSATYTNLDPGRYVFRVKAANNDGKWNTETAQLFLVILPPWWQTWWFRFLALSISIGFVMGSYFWRTRYIRRRNIELQEEVAAQTNELRHINEELTGLYTEVTESIQAAQIIQNGILPEQEMLEEYFGKIGVFYKPKNVVSGDFYWCAKIGERRLLAVIDCTGHGVAGAFMTFIAYETLNQIIRENPSAEAGQIITLLNHEILRSLNRYKTNKINAGMDVSLCIWNKEANTLEYAGANNPLYVVKAEKVVVYKADKQGVGGKQKHAHYAFATTYIQLEPKDQIYLFSDGFPDQVGGPSGVEKYMYPRFRNTLLSVHPLPLNARIERLETAFEEWRKGGEQLDDVLVIGLEV